MKEEILLKQLKDLQAVTPTAKFANSTRLSILGGEPVVAFQFPRVISQTLTASFSMAFTAFFLIIVLGSMTGSLKGALISAVLGVDGNILSEASAVSKDIDVRLEEANYSAALATQAKNALKEASSNGPGHLTPAILEREAEELQVYEEIDQNLDLLLNETDELLNKAIE